VKNDPIMMKFGTLKLIAIMIKLILPKFKF